jgi:pimeloyl-ACP methyl ester carboxylesterase
MNTTKSVLGALVTFVIALSTVLGVNAQKGGKAIDYRTNVDAYPKWQAWMQKTQPKLLVIWGKHDLSFDPAEPERYRKDVSNAEVHVLDAGHFALDTKADEIAALVRQFMKTQS